MKQVLRGKTGLVLAAVLFLLTLFCAEEAWAGDGFPGGEYKASDFGMYYENIQFSSDTIIILDADMRCGSILCDGDLEIRNEEGAAPHTLTLYWHDTVLRASGSLSLKNMNLNIAQEYDGTKNVINGGYTTIENCRVTIDSKSKGAVFSAYESLDIRDCEKIVVKAPNGSCSFYANSEIAIENSAIDLRSIHGMETAPGGAVSMDNVTGSIAAVNGNGIRSESVNLNFCDLGITAVGTGIAVDHGSAVVIGGNLKIEADGYGMEADYNIGLFNAVINITAKMNALSGTNQVIVENTTGTIAGTGASGIAVFGGEVVFNLSEVTVKGGRTVILSKPDGMLFYSNNYVKSPAVYKTLEQEVDGQSRDLLANPDNSWVKEAVIARKRISDSVCIAAVPEQTYTGSALTPPITLKWKAETLTPETDYTVDSYKNNINAGTAAVTVTGKGKYLGQADKTFTIKPASIAAASIGAIPEQTYTGAELKPAPSVTFNGMALKEGTDYTLSWSNNKEAGTATVTITGKGNFTGNTAVTFAISGKAEDGTPVGKGASFTLADQAITGMKNDEAPAGSRFGLLQLKAVSTKKTSVKLSWKKVSGTAKYVVYGNACGKKNRMKKLTTTAKRSLTLKKVAGKKVKANSYYKFLVIAVDQNNKVAAASKSVHVAAKGNKYGNDGKVTTAAAKKKNRITLQKGKTFKLKAKPVAASKKLKVRRHRGIAYESSDASIADVSKKGVIKAKKKKGSCYIYAYAQNGVFAKIRVTVR